MEYPDKEKYKKHFLKGFERIEKFNKNFISIFINASLNLVHSKFPKAKDKLGSDFFEMYATHFLQVLNSVLYKDDSYSDYRLKSELKRMNKVISYVSKPQNHTQINTQASKLFNQLAIDHFPSLYNLSGNGFRLLEINLKLFTRDFLTDFYFEYQK